MSDEEKIVKKKILVEKVEKPAQAPAPVPAKRISFEQWATNRSIPQRHFGGMKAWIKNAEVPRTEAAWDSAFVGY